MATVRISEEENSDRALMKGDESDGQPTARRDLSSAALAESSMELDPGAHSMPESIYGAGITYMVQSAMSENGRVHGTTIMIVLALLTNIVVQAYVLLSITWYITEPSVIDIQDAYAHYHEDVFVDGEFSLEKFEEWTSDERAQLCSFPLSQAQFFLVILSIWTAYALIDVKETLTLIILTVYLPSPAEGDVDTNLRGSEGDPDPNEGEVDGVVLEKMSLRLKTLIIASVLLPKFIIALYLWLIGARWLTATPSFEDLVLNALALSFITDLDEVVYQALLPVKSMEVVTMHSIKRTPYKDRNQRLTHNLGMMLSKAIIVVGLPYLYIYHLQHVLPNYKFDIAQHCSEYFQDMLAKRSGHGSGGRKR